MKNGVEEWKGREMGQECDEYSKGSLSKLICIKNKVWIISV